MPRSPRRRIRAAATILIAGSAFSLTACNLVGAPTSETEGAGEVTLAIVPDPSGASELYREQMDRCETENPGLTVNIIENPADQQLNAVELMFQQGDGPDVFQAQGQAALDRFQQKGWVASLSDYADDEFMDRFPDGTLSDPVLSGLYRDDELVSLPLTWGGWSYVSVLLYNKDVLAASGFDSAPETWSELDEIARKVSADNAGSVYGFAPTTGTASVINYLSPTGSPATIVTNGIDLTTGEANVSDPEFVDLVDTLTGMQADGVLEPGWESWDGTKGFQEMAAGRLAMYVTAPWHVAQVRSINPDLDLGIAAPPVPDSGRQAYNAQLSTFAPHWSMSSESENPDGAWQVLSCLASEEFQGAYYEKFGTLTAIESAWRGKTTEDQTAIVDIAGETVRYAPNPALQSPGGAAIFNALAGQTGLNPVAAAAGAIIGNQPFGPIAAALDEQIDAAVDAVPDASRDDITFADWDPLENYGG
jgi:ABC-type glycerol-3-phosphate transport system substrate-binding protein